MESLEQFKYNVANDERRLKFFVDKIQADLKRVGVNIHYGDKYIEKLILEKIKDFNDIPQTFGSYMLRYIKENQEKNSNIERMQEQRPTYPKNNIFSNSEMAIIELYLEKDENGQYKSTEEIAKALRTDIHNVSTTIYKLKTKLEESPYDIIKIFGDIVPIINDHKKESGKVKVKQKSKNTKLSDDDIRIIGSFTGQINDICIDIEDLASERGITPQQMREKIIDLYDLLENEENYKKLIAEFPQVNLMLKLKGNSIGAKIPLIVSTNGNPIFECAYFFQTLYEKNENGKYIDITTVMKKLGYAKRSTFDSRRRTLEKQIEKDSDFRRKVIERYHTLLEDKKEYDNKRKHNKNKDVDVDVDVEIEIPEDVKLDVKLLKYFYKLHDGKYYSEDIISELMEMTTAQVISKKDEILKQMDDDQEYRDLVLKEYPELYRNIEVYNNAPNEQKQGGINPKVIATDTKYLELMYTKNPTNNKYRSNSEISKELQVDLDTFYTNRDRILNELDTNPEYKKVIVKNLPLLEYNIKTYNDNKSEETKEEKFNKRKSRKISDTQIDKDIKALEYFYLKQEDGTYLSPKEIAAKLKIEEHSIYQRRTNILNRLEDDEYKAKILKKWPTLDEDMAARPIITHKRKSRKIPDTQIDKDIKALEYFYLKQEDGTYLSPEEIATQLEIGKNSIHKKRTDILNRLKNDEYKTKILKKWPTLDEDMAARPEFVQKPKSRKTSDTQIDNVSSAKDDKYEVPHLTEKEKEFANMLLTDETRKLEKGTSYAKNLQISYNSFNIIKRSTLAKIRNNPILQTDFPHFMDEYEIITNYSKRNSISISKEEYDNIRQNSRKYDMPNTKRNNRDNLIKGINNLEQSIYGDYAKLCTVEQKSILALRLGFFNNMEFSTETVSILFMTEPEEISLLTTECIKSAQSKKGKKNAQKKIGTKN